MKRFVAGVIIFVLLISAGVAELVSIRRLTSELSEISVEINELAQSGNQEGALNAAKKLEEHWADGSRLLNVFVRTEKLSTIQSLVNRISGLIEGESDELEAELDELKSMLEWIRIRELPTWDNIF